MTPPLCIILLATVIGAILGSVAAVSFNPYVVNAQDVPGSDQILIGEWRVEMVFPG